MLSNESGAARVPVRTFTFRVWAKSLMFGNESSWTCFPIWILLASRVTLHPVLTAVSSFPSVTLLHKWMEEMVGSIQTIGLTRPDVPWP